MMNLNLQPFFGRFPLAIELYEFKVFRKNNTNLEKAAVTCDATC